MYKGIKAIFRISGLSYRKVGIFLIGVYSRFMWKKGAARLKSRILRNIKKYEMKIFTRSPAINKHLNTALTCVTVIQY